MTDFAKIATVSAGTKLIADGRFTCIKKGDVLTVCADDLDELYVPCSQGRHYLDGQVDGEVYVGFRPVN